MNDERTKAGMSARELEVVDIVGEVMQERLAEVRREIAALEARLSKLEESKRLSYRGVFAPAEKYECGDYVTHGCGHGGGLWCCVRDTYDTPGRSASWRLAAKG